MTALPTSSSTRPSPSPSPRSALPGYPRPPRPPPRSPSSTTISSSASSTPSPPTPSLACAARRASPSPPPPPSCASGSPSSPAPASTPPGSPPPSTPKRSSLRPAPARARAACASPATPVAPKTSTSTLPSPRLPPTSSTSPPPGPCALWLGPEALLPKGDDDRGLWAVFAHQADSAVERQGLTRYRYRAEIAPGASQLPEPLTITSNGALDFATRSVPVSDDAVAIRNFPLVERGLAVGLGLSPREAALRRTDPNGGVRNLVVAPGTWPTTPSTTTRTIEVRRLQTVSLDLTTGDASLDIALGFEHRPDRPGPTPFTGGTIRLDLITALARARRSSQLLRRGAYHGPASILIDDAELIS
jgi:hypothetical protein